MRNVAIVDAVAVGLCILAVTPIISLYTTDMLSLYQGYFIWTRSLGWLVLAGVVWWLHPRETHWKPVGNF